MEIKLERRFLNEGELRVKKAGDKRTIFGYATKFAPVQSADLGGWVEEIHPNAFDECLRGVPDVVGLWNHDVNHVLGRTTSGTLRLSVDKTGLLYEIDPPDTGLANDLMTLMDRGDVHQSSFGFYCIEDSWREGPDGTYIRTVLKAELFDVSPVTFPAYPDATSGVRHKRYLRSLFPEGCDGINCKLTELRAAKEGRAEDAPGQKMKTVDGVHLHADNFAYVGDPNDPETWKLPIKFPGDEVKTKSHIRDALARFNQTEGIPDSEKSKVWDKIVAAAKENGIEVSKENKSLAHAFIEHRAAAKTKEVDGSHLTAEDFAYVGDPDKTDTWKLPIHFPGDDVKTKDHIRNALARFNQTEGIPASEKQKVWDRIVAAAKANGIQVTQEHKSAALTFIEHRDEATAPAANSATRTAGDCHDNPQGEGCEETNDEDDDDDMEAVCEDDPDVDGCEDYNAKKRAKKVRSGNVDPDEAEEGEVRCDCGCTSCVLGDCVNCVNEDCESASCESCSMQSKRSATPAPAAAEVPAVPAVDEGLELLRARLLLSMAKAGLTR